MTRSLEHMITVITEGSLIPSFLMNYISMVMTAVGKKNVQTSVRSNHHMFEPPFGSSGEPNNGGFLSGGEKERIVCSCALLLSLDSPDGVSLAEWPADLEHNEVSGALSLGAGEFSQSTVVLWSVAKDTKCIVWNELWRTFASHPLLPTYSTKSRAHKWYISGIFHFLFTFAWEWHALFCWWFSLLLTCSKQMLFQ